jgi:hypothetical protein
MKTVYLAENVVDEHPTRKFAAIVHVFVSSPAKVLQYLQKDK